MPSIKTSPNFLYFGKGLFFFPDLADLEAKENILDKMIANCTKSLKEMTENPDNSRYPLYESFSSSVCPQLVVLWHSQKRVPYGSVVKCSACDNEVLGSRLTGFHGSVLWQDT